MQRLLGAHMSTAAGCIRRSIEARRLAALPSSFSPLAPASGNRSWWIRNRSKPSHAPVRRRGFSVWSHTRFTSLIWHHPMRTRAVNRSKLILPSCSGVRRWAFPMRCCIWVRTPILRRACACSSRICASCCRRCPMGCLSRWRRWRGRVPRSAIGSSISHAYWRRCPVSG
jgi:hypothetical protein